jgi:hypothetical protein
MMLEVSNEVETGFLIRETDEEIVGVAFRRLRADARNGR